MLTLRKYKFSERRKFILIFALGRTAILFTIFYHAIKIDYLFMFYNNIIEDYSKKNMENKKKSKAKKYYQANKEKLQKRSRENYRNPYKHEEIEKRNYSNIRNLNISDADRERKKNI